MHGINLSLRAGELHVLFGANGSGKSSLDVQAVIAAAKSGSM
jgi:Fe-S cluster assembly ATPase SufC